MSSILKVLAHYNEFKLKYPRKKHKSNTYPQPIFNQGFVTKCKRTGEGGDPRVSMQKTQDKKHADLRISGKDPSLVWSPGLCVFVGFFFAFHLWQILGLLYCSSGVKRTFLKVLAKAKALEQKLVRPFPEQVTLVSCLTQDRASIKVLRADSMNLDLHKSMAKQFIWWY